MNKMLAVLLLLGVGFGAEAQNYTNDLAGLESAWKNRDYTAMLDSANQMMTYTNRPFLAYRKVLALNGLDRSAEGLVLAESVQRKDLILHCYVGLGRYMEAYNLFPDGEELHLKMMAISRGNLFDAVAVNKIVEAHFKVCGNITNAYGYDRVLKRQYTRSRATTADYVELCRNILRVVETNAENIEFKSFIKSELEANL